MPSEEDSGYVADVPPDALVIRFRPTAPEKVVEAAQKALRITGHARLSVFADVARQGETESALLQRLVDAAGLSGINLGKNPKCYICSRAQELLGRGLVFWKDGDDDERDEHYSVDLGIEPTGDTVKDFLAAFPQEERWAT